MGLVQHEPASDSQTVEWYTPTEILDALGPFDDDPCLPGKVDGLVRPWNGLVWLNPPYGREMWPWLKKLATHGSGIALIFARTETQGFWQTVWGKADSLLFLKGRLQFIRGDGEPASGNAGAPSVLIGYGEVASKRLAFSGLEGAFVHNWLLSTDNKQETLL